jgi:hypothetical protein
VVALHAALHRVASVACASVQECPPAFEGLRGSGEMEVVYGPDADSPTHVTFTGTVTR